MARGPAAQALLFALFGALGTAGLNCSGRIVGEGSPDGGGKADDPAQDGDEEDWCAAEPCDLHDQCGCQSGEACDLDGDALASAGTRCRPADPGGQSLATCSRGSDCAAGYGCFGDPGQCRKFCEGDGECGFGYCFIQVVYDAGGGDMQDVPGATVCTKACKPESATGSGCPAEPGFGCSFSYRDPNGAPDSGDEFWYTDCRQAATSGGRHAADCSARGDADCAPGHSCMVISYSDGSQRDECRQICVWMVGDKEGERRCDSGRTCGKLNDVLVGDTEYGACG